MKKIKTSLNANKSAIVFISLAFLIFVFYNMFSLNIVQGLSKYGSRGTEVTQIQEKLKRWGYYKGSVDGVYGSGTLEAVKYFQRKNGLAVDGIAGKSTLEAMGIYSSSSSSGGSGTASNSSDLNLLTRLIYGEARGEPYTGQVAVAATVLNRVKNSAFPNTIAGVIYQSGAYTAVQDRTN